MGVWFTSSLGETATIHAKLPPSEIVNMTPYSLPVRAREGITPVISDLKEKEIIVPVHSPYNTPVWPVHKPDGRWWLTVDY